MAFRDKFEQRRDPRFNAVLEAADEVVWSSYRPFFQPPNAAHPLQPPPLPYVELDFSPSSLRRDQKEVLGRRDADFTLVKAAFAELPIPILRLPITAINNPWVLVLIGHEVGRHRRASWRPNSGAFQSAVQDAVASTSQHNANPVTWGVWADEIFADLYSIFTLGPSAVWAMTQFETAENAVMARRRFVYPSPVVRLALMTAFARHYALELEPFELPPAPADELARALRAIEPVVKVVAALPEISGLVECLPFSALMYGQSRCWSLERGRAMGAPPARQGCGAGHEQAAERSHGGSRGSDGVVGERIRRRPAAT